MEQSFSAFVINTICLLLKYTKFPAWHSPIQILFIKWICAINSISWFSTNDSMQWNWHNQHRACHHMTWTKKDGQKINESSRKLPICEYRIKQTHRDRIFMYVRDRMLFQSSTMFQHFYFFFILLFRLSVCLSIRLSIFVPGSFHIAYPLLYVHQIRRMKTSHIPYSVFHNWTIVAQ